ncbi:tRNA pseudouridine(55) synthase TruB, partial [Oleiphilus sp. HI0079]|uniref:tRNA pseudouridine(55) synthase TruB n=2 Tax=Oleiphilus TaxID=141450 RepID=UPI0007C256E9
KGRLLDGVLLLDKPLDITSNGALQKVRWLYDARRAGHTGALDPLATGVLPICFGEATKFAKYLLESDKAYYTTAQLGEIRESGDSEGEVVETRDLPVLNKEIVESVLEKFRGETLQVPTMYSALKHQGRPLYEWARKGITVEREARPINVPTLRLDDVTRDTLSLYVECSKGTYIRSLVEDIGLELGCGAHVSMLRRSRAGHFELSETVT